MSSLPKASISRLIDSYLKETSDERTSTVKFSRDSVEMICECATEFLFLLTSEAASFCNNEKKDTISPNNIIDSIKSLEFGEEFIDKLTQEKEAHQRFLSDVRKRKKTKESQPKLSPEDLKKGQEALLAKARESMNKRMRLE